jgi:hypothetical protein
LQRKIKNDMVSNGTSKAVQLQSNWMVETGRKMAMRIQLNQTNSMELSPWEAPVVQLLKKFPIFYGSRRFITVFTESDWSRPYHLILPL